MYIAYCIQENSNNNQMYRRSIYQSNIGCYKKREAKKKKREKSRIERQSDANQGVMSHE